MPGHHLILGELVDIITGETLEDTHDERLRQNIAGLLVNDKGFARDDIRPRWELAVKADDKCALVKIDFGIVLDDRVCMMIKYGPGSLVTRHRPALAASRLLAPYQIPVIVVTNGLEADILDGLDGRVTAKGLDAIPDRQQLVKTTSGRAFSPIQPDKMKMASRIMYAFEVDDSCPCDDTVCRITNFS